MLQQLENDNQEVDRIMTSKPCKARTYGPLKRGAGLQIIGRQTEWQVGGISPNCPMCHPGTIEIKHC